MQLRKHNMGGFRHSVSRGKDRRVFHKTSHRTNRMNYMSSVHRGGVVL